MIWRWSTGCCTAQRSGTITYIDAVGFVGTPNILDIAFAHDLDGNDAGVVFGAFFVGDADESLSQSVGAFVGDQMTEFVNRNDAGYAIAAPNSFGIGIDSRNTPNAITTDHRQAGTILC